MPQHVLLIAVIVKTRTSLLHKPLTKTFVRIYCAKKRRFEDAFVV